MAESYTLNEKELKTLFTLFYAGIKNTFKQFNWEATIDNDMEVIDPEENSFAMIWSDLGGSENLQFDIAVYSKKGIVKVARLYKDSRGKSRALNLREKLYKGYPSQNFPITGGTQKKLEELVTNITKWVEKEIKKLKLD